jgi:hypothetical protein
VVDSGPACAIMATTSGNSGTFDSMQDPCVSGGGTGAGVTYGGSLTLNGNSLNYTLNAMAGGQMISEQASCTRH